jgi:hypothetical protein
MTMIDDRPAIDAPEPPALQPYQLAMVEMLESALAKARAGQMLACAIIEVVPAGYPVWGHVAGVGANALITGAACFQWELIGKTLHPPVMPMPPPPPEGFKH